MTSRTLGDASQTRDSYIVRASVFDVCLQLGALDDNSLIAEWMFNDPSSNGSDILHSNGRDGATRFQEMMPLDLAADSEEVAPKKHRRRLFSKLSLNTKSFNKHRYSKSTTKPATSESLRSEHPPTRIPRSSGTVSLRRRSIFKRANPSNDVNEPMASSLNHTDRGGHISTNPRSFFQRKLSAYEASRDSSKASPSSITIHPDSVNHHDDAFHAQDEDGDDSWEEIEAIPNSPLYPLPNKGMNPPAIYPRERKLVKKSGRDLDTGISVRGAANHNSTFAFRHSFFRRSAVQSRDTPSHHRGRSSSMPGPSSSRFGGRSSPKRLSATPSSPRGIQMSNSAREGKNVGNPSSFRSRFPFVLSPRNHRASSVAPPGPVAHPTSELAIPAEKGDMGYHHQFFMQAEMEALERNRSMPTKSSGFPKGKNHVYFLSSKGSL